MAFSFYLDAPRRGGLQQLSHLHNTTFSLCVNLSFMAVLSSLDFPTDFVYNNEAKKLHASGGQHMDVMLIGIAGGTGSGKTTLTEHLKQHFGDDVTVIHHDSYYKRQDIPFQERCKTNYDHPDAFDTPMLIEHLRALKEGKSVEVPVYSYVEHQRTDKVEIVHPSKVVIVEGILLFHDPTLRQMLDIKIFVETDADVRILRRALRDVRDRGRTLESVINQYLSTVKPMHEQFVEPSRKHADIIVLEGGHNLVALDMIMQRIASHISEKE